MTEQQYDLLMRLNRDVWVTPKQMGGTQRSHVSRTLLQLVALGYAEKRERRNSLGLATGAYVYRRTPEGHRIARGPRPLTRHSSGKVR